MLNFNNMANNHQEGTTLRDVGELLRSHLSNEHFAEIMPIIMKYGETQFNNGAKTQLYEATDMTQFRHLFNN